LHLRRYPLYGQSSFKKTRTVRLGRGVHLQLYVRSADGKRSIVRKQMESNWLSVDQCLARRGVLRICRETFAVWLQLGEIGLCFGNEIGAAFAACDVQSFIREDDGLFAVASGRIGFG
jgi:hypothetical protein